MKQQKLSGYSPRYPRKTLKGMALAAAALMTLGTSAGCVTERTPRAPVTAHPTPGVETPCPTEDVGIDGYVQPEKTPGEGPAVVGLLEYCTPEPEDVRTGGVAMPEDTPEPEEIQLMGDVAIFEEPTQQPLLTTGEPTLPPDWGN